MTDKTVNNSRSLRELSRIYWRQWVLSFPSGVRWLSWLVRRRIKEQDLGPHKYDFEPGVTDEPR